MSLLPARRDMGRIPAQKVLWWALLTVPLLLSGTDAAKAAEHGEPTQKGGTTNGTSVSKHTEDPVFTLMRERGWVTKEQYVEAFEQAGRKWIEPADAVLILRNEFDWNRYLKTGLRLPDWVDLGLEQRTRFEAYNHPWRAVQKPGNGSTDQQFALRSRVRFGLGGNGPLRFLFEGQDSRSFLDGDPGDFRNDTTVNEFDILQLFGSLTVKNVMGTGLRTDFHLGRLTMDFGGRRLVSRNNVRNTTSSFDGFHWQINRDRAWRLRAFIVEPVVIELVRLDQLRSDVTFWGAYFEDRHVPWFNFDAYYFGLNDKRVASAANHRTFSTYGGRLFKEPRPAELDYQIETTWQIGAGGGIERFAHFQHVSLGYSPDLLWSPRVLFHFDYASGDRQAKDNEETRFDSLFGDPRFELMPVALFNPFFRTNLLSPGWRVIVAPKPGLLLQLKHRVWYLAQSEGEFAGSGLRDPTGRAGNSLGHDVELHALWWLHTNLQLDVGYVHWFKGSYFDNPAILAQMPQGGNKDTDYFYVSVLVRV